MLVRIDALPSGAPSSTGALAARAGRRSRTGEQALLCAGIRRPRRSSSAPA
ncbi:MAG TPA: hypothetical protein VNF07_01840 [Acidimicrobiales bacterium]|nr:hypothetical protein [Acidimicrobiales bacterium]